MKDVPAVECAARNAVGGKRCGNLLGERNGEVEGGLPGAARSRPTFYSHKRKTGSARILSTVAQPHFVRPLGDGAFLRRVEFSSESAVATASIAERTLVQDKSPSARRIMASRIALRGSSRLASSKIFLVNASVVLSAASERAIASFAVSATLFACCINSL